MPEGIPSFPAPCEPVSTPTMGLLDTAPRDGWGECPHEPVLACFNTELWSRAQLPSERNGLVRRVNQNHAHILPAATRRTAIEGWSEAEPWVPASHGTPPRRGGRRGHHVDIGNDPGTGNRAPPSGRGDVAGGVIPGFPRLPRWGRCPAFPQPSLCASAEKRPSPRAPPLRTPNRELSVSDSAPDRQVSSE